MLNKDLSLSKVFPHEQIPNGDFPDRVEVLSPGNKDTNSWQHVFACWMCDRNHGYDLGDGNPLQSPGCEVRTENITMKQRA